MKIPPPQCDPPETDCICPIGEDLILRGLHHVVPGEFYAAATRPPAVYRGNPFVVEVGLAYGGTAPTQTLRGSAVTTLSAGSPRGSDDETSSALRVDLEDRRR